MLFISQKKEEGRKKGRNAGGRRRKEERNGKQNVRLWMRSEKREEEKYMEINN